MTHYKPNKDKTMLVEVPKMTKPRMYNDAWTPVYTGDNPYIPYLEDLENYEKHLASLKSYPAHPSLIEWMQREGKEVVREDEILIKELSDGSHEWVQETAFPPPQTEDDRELFNGIALILIDRDPYATNYDLTTILVDHLKSKYHLTRKL